MAGRVRNRAGRLRGALIEAGSGIEGFFKIINQTIEHTRQRKAFGQGFMWEPEAARTYSDVRLWSIVGGADKVILGIISKLMGTLPRRKG